jgi:hypothetical protein
MSKIYRFIEDPGHAWLEVTLSELLELGIAHKISSFSYTTGPRPTAGATALVYLEEDVDAPLFIEAKGWEPWRITERHVVEVFQDPTFVRNLAPYAAPERRQT